MSDEPVLVEVVELLDVFLADEVLLPSAAGSHTLQGHLGLGLGEKIRFRNNKNCETPHQTEIRSKNILMTRPGGRQ